MSDWRLSPHVRVWRAGPCQPHKRASGRYVWASKAGSAAARELYAQTKELTAHLATSAVHGSTRTAYRSHPREQTVLSRATPDSFTSCASRVLKVYLYSARTALGVVRSSSTHQAQLMGDRSDKHSQFPTTRDGACSRRAPGPVRGLGTQR